MIIERATRNQRIPSPLLIHTTILYSNLPMTPIHTVRQTLMLIIALRDLPLLPDRRRPLANPLLPRLFLCGLPHVPEAYNFEAGVHGGDEEVVLAVRIGVPFDAPGAALDVGLGERGEELSGVEEAYGVVVAVYLCVCVEVSVG